MRRDDLREVVNLQEQERLARQATSRQQLRRPVQIDPRLGVAVGGVSGRLDDVDVVYRNANSSFTGWWTHSLPRYFS